MSKQIILHVGAPKTATTSLQRAFKSQEALLKSRGIAYAIEGLRHGIAHHDLIEAVAERNTKVVDRYFDDARAHHDGAERILISSEVMHRLSREELVWWRDCLNRRFDDPAFAIWIFVRRLSSLVPSRWHGYLRKGGRQNLPAFAFDAINHVLSARRLPFEAAFERFADVFGPSAVNVVPMEKVIASDGDFIVGVFKRMLGIENEQLRGLPHRNSALDPGEAELLRALAIRYAQDDAEHVREFVWPLIPLLQKGDNIFSDLARMFDPYVEHLTIEDRSEMIVMMERNAIDRLGAQLDAWDGDTIFGPADPDPAPYIRDEYWFDERVRQRLDQAYSKAVALPKRAARRSAAT